MGVLILAAMGAYVASATLVAWILSTERLFDPPLEEGMSTGRKALLLAFAPLSLGVGILVALLLAPFVMKRHFESRNNYYVR